MGCECVIDIVGSGIIKLKLGCRHCLIIVVCVMFC